MITNGVNHTPVKKNVSIFPPENINNDDLERLQFRNLVALRKSIGDIPSAESSLNDSLRNWNEEDVNYHMQFSMKLFVGNKLNEKNAWDVKIIDALRRAVVTKAQSADLLKLVSPSLEVASKVYGLRVDSLHTETNKWVRGLAKLFAQKAADDEEDKDASDDTSATENKEKRRHKKKKQAADGAPKATVNHDPKSYRAPLPKLESPLFSAGIDPALSLMGNLFTNKMKTDYSGTRFMLLSTEPAWIPEKDIAVEATRGLKYPLKMPKLKTYAVCTSFANFTFDNAIQETEEPEQFLYRPSECRQSDLVSDINGIPLHELDGSIQDIFENPHDDVTTIEPEDNVADFHREVTYVTSVQQVMEHARESVRWQSVDVTEIDETAVDAAGWGVMDRVWAGPSHWKFKYVKSKNCTYTGKNEVEKRVPRKRVPKPEESKINFGACLDMPKKEEVKKCPTRTQRRHRREEEYYLPLPEIDGIGCSDDVGRLMTFPNIVARPKRRAKTLDVDFNVRGCDYENHIVSDYCLQEQPHNQTNIMPLEDAYDDNDDVSSVVSSVAGERVEPMAFVGENLVELPEMVDAVSIPYATKPKKVDIKKLKMAVWKVLTGKERYELTDSDRAISGRFSSVFSALQRSLHERVARELTCHLALFAVLQLCNEFNIQLDQTDSTDFKIVKT